MNVKKIIFALLLAVGLGHTAWAAGDTPDNGTCGGCTWTVSHETLTISPTSGDEADLGTWTGNAPWHDACANARVTTVKVTGTVRPLTLSRMFADLTYLHTLDLSGLDLSKVPSADNIDDMFDNTPFPLMASLPSPEKLSIADGEAYMPLPAFSGVIGENYIQALGDNGTWLDPQGSRFKGSTDLFGSGSDLLKEENVKKPVQLVRMQVPAESVYKINATTGFGTLCYPTQVNMTDDEKNWKARPFKVTDVQRTEGNKVAMTITEYKPSDGNIPAHTPVLLYKAGGTSITLNAHNVAVSLAPLAIAEEGNMLVGCNAPFTLFGDPDTYTPSKSRQYVYENKPAYGIAFYRVHPDTPVHATAYRCFLQLPEEAVEQQLNAPSLSLAAPGDQPTGIGSLTAPDAVQGAIYDMQGRRVNDIKRGGMYIVNGVKLIVK